MGRLARRDRRSRGLPGVCSATGASLARSGSPTRAIGATVAAGARAGRRSAALIGSRIGLQCLYSGSSGRGLASRLAAHPRQSRTLASIGRAVLPLQQGREPVGQCRRPLGVRHPLRQGLATAGPLDARLVPPAIHGKRPGVVAATRQSPTEVSVAVGVVGLDPDPLAAAATASSSFLVPSTVASPGHPRFRRNRTPARRDQRSSCPPP
jgi:hypothetical protein